MSACLLWLIMLLFTRLSQRPHHCPEQQTQGNKTVWVVGGACLCVPGCADVLFLSSLPNTALSNALSSFTSVLSSRLPPLHMHGYAGFTWRDKMPQDLHPPLGAHLECLRTSKHYTHSQAVEMWLFTSCLLMSLLEPCSEGCIALIAAQQVEHRGEGSLVRFIPKVDLMVLYISYTYIPNRFIPSHLFKGYHQGHAKYLTSIKV